MPFGDMTGRALLPRLRRKAAEGETKTKKPKRRRNNMKKIANKTICLLLTLVLLLGVMPLAGIGTFRAKAAEAGETVIKAADIGDIAASPAATAPTPLRAAAAEPTWVEVGREKKHEDRMKKLITLLTSPHEYHIKLVGHIDIYDKNDLPIWGKTRGIQIKGVKHLDMNGCNISYEHTGVGYSKAYSLDPTNENAEYLYYLMTVTEDASFYLYDSTGKNGKIFFGQPMYFSETPYRNIISVKGRFTMYGGEISTGASKKLHYTNKPKTDSAGFIKGGFNYTGNARLQLQGSGVTVEDGGYFELNGGDVYGRGTHFAAIEGRPGSTVLINDGYIEGAGGADVYSGGYQRRAWYGWRKLRDADALEHGKLTVNGGRFNARVIDAEVLHYAHDYGGPVGIYDDMKPGKIAIFDGLNPNSDCNMSYTTIGGGDTLYLDGAKVSMPTDGVSRQSKRITLEAAPGYDTTYYHPNDAFVINVGYQSYWGKNASVLENDYNPNSWCRLFYMFYLYKVGESTPIAEYYSEKPRLNLRDLRDYKTNAWPRYETGAKYYIRVLVSEAWNNRYHTVYEGIQDWYFTATDFESRKIDFDYKVTISDKPTTDGHTVYNVALTDECVKSIRDMGYSDRVRVSYAYRYYEGTNSNTQPVDYWLSNEFKLDGTTPYSIVTGKTGPLFLKVTLTFRESNNLNAKTIATFEKECRVFSSGEIKYTVQNKGGSVPGYKWKSQGEGSTKLEYGQKIWLNHGLQDYLDDGGWLDPYDNTPIDQYDIIWQYLDGNTWENVTTGDTRFSIEDVKVKEEGRTYQRLLCTDRNGIYRYGVKYLSPDGKGHQFYWSTCFFNVEGVDYAALRTVTISSSASETEYGQGTTIRASRNTGIADWGGFRRYRLDIIEAPANYRGFDIGPTSSSLQDSETGVWNLDEYFNKATAENMIPGEYVFRVVAIGYVSGVKYEVYSNTVTVKYEKHATGYRIIYRGTDITITKDESVVGTFNMGPFDTLPLDIAFVPKDATYARTTTSGWKSSNPEVATVDEYGYVTSHSPGTARITYYARWDKDDSWHECHVDVIVPIYEFKIQTPDLADHIGEKFVDVLPVVTAVRSYNGEWVTGEKAQACLTVETLKISSQFKTYYEHVGESVIAYNDAPEITYMFKPTEGNTFCLRHVMNNYYLPDIDVVGCNGFDNDQTVYELNKLGATYPSSYGVYGYNPDTTSNPWNAYLLLTRYADFLYEPGTTYIDTLEITTNEPYAGDNRVWKFDDKHYQYMDLKFGGLENITAVDLVWSYASKLNDTINGSGVPYEDASSEQHSTGALEYTSCFVYGEDGLSLLPPTKKYESGLYMHKLAFKIGSDVEADGKYRLAPDAKVYINGHYMPFAQLTDSYGRSRIDVDYYFSVGEPEPYGGADDKHLMLVKPQDYVRTGEPMPDVFDFRVVWKDKLDDAGRNVETKLSVLGVTWFIDRNGNGKFDAGEDANIFDAKGNALPNTVYSGVLALAAEDNANVRFADPCRLYLGGGNYALIDESNLTVTFTLGADFYELHTGMILPTGGATGSFKMFTLRPTAALNGLSIVDEHIEKEDGTILTESQPMTAGTTYYYCITYQYEPSFFLATDYPELPSTARVVIDGIELGNDAWELTTKTVGDKTFYSGFKVRIPCWAEGTGRTVSGTITTFLDDTDAVTVTLTREGDSSPSYAKVVYGNSAAYKFDSVAEGTYIMTVSKKNHVTRTEKVVVGATTVTKNMKVHPKGDINGDGKITTLDYMKVNAYVKGTVTLTEYELKCADVIGTDGKVTTADAMRINAHVKGTKPLW